MEEPLEEELEEDFEEDFVLEERFVEDDPERTEVNSDDSVDGDAEESADD